MERQTTDYIHVLIAVPDDDMRAGLMRILDHSSWVLSTAETWEEAVKAITSRAIPVVVCVHDQVWKSVLDQAHRQHPPTRVVVTDRAVDEALWAEVLSLGGYDVLPQPFNRKEVFRTLTSAWRSWHEANHPHPVAAA